MRSKDLNDSEIKAKSGLNHSPVSEKRSEEKKRQSPRLGKLSLSLCKVFKDLDHQGGNYSLVPRLPEVCNTAKKYQCQPKQSRVKTQEATSTTAEKEFKLSINFATKMKRLLGIQLTFGLEKKKNRNKAEEKWHKHTQKSSVSTLLINSFSPSHLTAGSLLATLGSCGELTLKSCQTAPLRQSPQVRELQCRNTCYYLDCSILDRILTPTSIH